MRKSRIMGLIFAEALLLALTIYFGSKIIADEKPQKRYAVIIEKSGDNKWKACINGLKESAKNSNVHLVVCNTDEIEKSDEIKLLIEGQMGNDIDGFIICPAAGDDSLDIIKSAVNEKPVILIGDDALSENVTDYSSYHSEMTVSMPDYYEMGQRLGEELAKKYDNNLSDVSIGIVAGIEGRYSTVRCLEGVKETIEKYGGDEKWVVNRAYDGKLIDNITEGEAVDNLIILDTDSAEAVCSAIESEVLEKKTIFAICSSLATVSSLDKNYIECLIMPDYFEMGYKAVKEIAAKGESSLYRMTDSICDYRVFYKEDIFSRENDEFLYYYKE